MTYAIILQIDGAHHVALRGIRVGDWTQAHLAMRYPHPGAAARARMRFLRKHPAATVHIVPTPKLLAIFAGRLSLMEEFE